MKVDPSSEVVAHPTFAESASFLTHCCELVCVSLLRITVYTQRSFDNIVAFAAGTELGSVVVPAKKVSALSDAVALPLNLIASL